MGEEQNQQKLCVDCHKRPADKNANFITENLNSQEIVVSGRCPQCSKERKKWVTVIVEGAKEFRRTTSKPPYPPLFTEDTSPRDVPVFHFIRSLPNTEFNALMADLIEKTDRYQWEVGYDTDMEEYYWQYPESLTKQTINITDKWEREQSSSEKARVSTANTIHYPLPYAIWEWLQQTIVQRRGKAKQ